MRADAGSGAAVMETPVETPQTAATEAHWITIDVAAEVIGRDRKWIDRQVARHRLRTRVGTNARNMRVALVERAEVVRLHEQARGHISDSAVIDSDATGDSGDSGDVSTGDSPGGDGGGDGVSGVAVVPDGAAAALAWRDVSWALAGMVAQQGREVAHLRAELGHVQQQVGEERGRRQAAEQRLQTLLDAAATAETERPWWRRLLGLD